MAEPQSLSLNTLRMATRRLATLFDALVDPRLSWLAEQALANPAQIAEYVDQYRRTQREHNDLRAKFASLAAARSIGAEGANQRSDGIAALFDRFKKIEQQTFRSIVNNLVQHVVTNSANIIPAQSQQALRYEIMAVLSQRLLLEPFRALMDETTPAPEQLSKLAKPIRMLILNGSAITETLPKNDPILDDLTTFVERQVADLVANGLALLRSSRSIDAATLSEFVTNAEDVIRHQYRIPIGASMLLDELHNAASSCVDLAYQLTRSNVACILWIPERGMLFNPDAHRGVAGTTELGGVKMTLFPALTIGSRVIERALVLTDGGNALSDTEDL